MLVMRKSRPNSITGLRNSSHATAGFHAEQALGSAGYLFAASSKEHRGEGKREERGGFRYFLKREVKVAVAGGGSSSCPTGIDLNPILNGPGVTGLEDGLSAAGDHARGRPWVAVSRKCVTEIERSVVWWNVLIDAQKKGDAHPPSGESVVVSPLRRNKQVLIGAHVDPSRRIGRESEWVHIGGSLGCLDQEITRRVIPCEIEIGPGAARASNDVVRCKEWILNSLGKCALMPAGISNARHHVPLFNNDGGIYTVRHQRDADSKCKESNREHTRALYGALWS